MAHYAKVLDGIVLNVVVANASFLDTFIDDSPGEWIETCYQTSNNNHSSGGNPLRKNFASIGGTYNKALDAFIGAKPFDSWILDQDKGIWKAPSDYPTSGMYNWDEDTLAWIEHVI
jgi:hypothetical protein